ncbi:MAG: hypothetical protein UHN47_03530 [Lachnospiraceae bacterium]|nr:hypothetical protein [Lachnospiraceae bacterium]
MYREKLGSIQKYTIAIIVMLIITIIGFYGIFSDNKFLPYICAVLLFLSVGYFVINDKYSKVLYVSRSKRVIIEQFYNTTKQYTFHSDIYDDKTDHPYFMITNHKEQTWRISVTRANGKWYLIKEELKEPLTVELIVDDLEHIEHTTIPMPDELLKKYMELRKCKLPKTEKVNIKLNHYTFELELDNRSYWYWNDIQNEEEMRVIFQFPYGDREVAGIAIRRFSSENKE